MAEQYRLRHKNIWPEMKLMLHEAGIANYSIWMDGDTVFGYYETDNPEQTARVKGFSPVQARWSKYMAEIVETDEDGNMVIHNLRQVFLLE